MLSGLKQVFALLDRKARRQFLVLGFMTVIAAVLETAGVGLVFPFIKVISEPGWIYGLPWFAAFFARTGPIDHHTLTLAIGGGLLAHESPHF
jgi:ATP-binding cassette subfamily C protein